MPAQRPLPVPVHLRARDPERSRGQQQMLPMDTKWIEEVGKRVRRRTSRPAAQLAGSQASAPCTNRTCPKSAKLQNSCRALRRGALKEADKRHPSPTGFPSPGWYKCDRAAAIGSYVHSMHRGCPTSIPNRASKAGTLSRGRLALSYTSPACSCGRGRTEVRVKVFKDESIE